MCAAIYAAQKNRKLKIALIEALDRVGKKLITTGNGRCNITNRDIAISRYHGGDTAAAQKILSRFPVEEAVRFFSSIGVEIVFSEDGRAYPSSFQAASVVDALRFSLSEYGIETLTETRVTDIVPTRNGIRLSTSKGNIEASSVILASGLLAGGPKIGSDGSVFNLLSKMGYKSSKLTPSLVQLKTATDFVRHVKGIRFDCLVSLVRDGKKLRSEYGELLFTEYGLSGPPIFQLSREVSRKNGNFEISLDLLPEMGSSDLVELLRQRRQNLRTRTSEEFLTGFLNKRVGQVILKQCGVPSGIPGGDIEDPKLILIARQIKDLRFGVTGTTGMTNCQVTAGGISLSEFDGFSLESLRHPGLFAAGELLDVDGDCGGFNLQWAWSSAMAAAVGAVKKCSR